MGGCDMARLRCMLTLHGRNTLHIPGQEVVEQACGACCYDPSHSDIRPGLYPRGNRRDDEGGGGDGATVAPELGMADLVEWAAMVDLLEMVQG